MLLHSPETNSSERFFLAVLDANFSIFLNNIASCRDDRCGNRCHVKLFSFCHDHLKLLCALFTPIDEDLTDNIIVILSILWPVIIIHYI